MKTLTKIALAGALVVGCTSIALADSEFDPNLGNRYPAYNGPVAAPGTLYSAPVAMHHRRHLRSAPVELHSGGAFYNAPVRLRGEENFYAPTQGGGNLPRAFYEQQQPGFPQSPPGVGGY
jgi:hypothetical protein